MNEAIVQAGSENLNGKEVEFKFRDKEYGAKFNDGKFEYVRLFQDTAGLVRDVRTNDGFKREINGKTVNLPDTMSHKYSNSVNSVIYFALLPYSLNDAAVNKNYLGEVAIKDKQYHKIKVTFDPAGGGEDFEDVFIYWVNKDTKNIDYLAYEYNTNGGGMRFREAYNERTISDIRFVDYNNLQPTEEVELEKIDEAYSNGKLEKLSEINLESITVSSIE